jgi:hypothetical protein
MRQSYSHLLTLLFKHRYFRDDLFKSVQISYAEGTPKLMKDLDIIVKPFAGGFHLMASDPELLKTINDTYPIQFHLFCNDPLYINYTDLPIYQLSDKLLYFNNISAVSDPNGEGFLLNDEEFVGKNEVVQISYGRINISASNSGKEYSFTDAVGNEISSQFISQSSQNSNEFSLANLPQGIIRIYADKKEVDKVYYYPKAIWQKPLGIAEIFPGKLFTHFKDKGKADYSVVFNNRQTIWKYFLVSPVYQKFTNLSIINKGKEQVFNAPQKQHVDKNPEALVFESKIKIPLSELSDENYQLVDNYDPEHRSGKVILKNLVKASPEQLYYDGTKSKESAYSHIYL